MSIHTVADDGTNQAFIFTAPPSRATISSSEEIHVSGAGRFAVTASGQVGIAVNLAPAAHATGEFHLASKNDLNISGDASTSLTVNVTSDFAAADVIIQPSVLGTAQMLVGSAGTLEFKNSVAEGISVGLNKGLLKLDRPADFQAAVTSSDGEIVLDGLIEPTAYDVANGKLTIYNTVGTAIDTLRFTDTSPTQTGLAVRLIGGEVQVIEQSTLNGADPSTLGGTALTQHVAPAPAPQVVAVHDNTTGADLPDMSTHYTGPVAGLVSQFINVTPDNLNIAAMADGLFIKTGAGNDAVALRGGTNVVDCGAGSNFVTSGSGFDTFFLDARNIPAAASAAGPVPGAIWDTISNFHSSDAATLWGITPGTALAWQKNEGAVGHTGLTLHANMPNGSEASLTLAGIDSKAGLQLSYGSVGGSSYLYVKAA